MSLRRRKANNTGQAAPSFFREFISVSRRSIGVGLLFGAASLTSYIVVSQRQNGSFRDSYNHVPALVAKRDHHHQIPLVLGEKKCDRVLEEDLWNFDLSVPFGKSVEPVTIIDARKDPRIDTKNVVAVAVIEEPEVRTLTPSLDTRAWPDFIRGGRGSEQQQQQQQENDEVVFISLGTRRAFGTPLSKLGLLHAVVLVQIYPKGQKQQKQQKQQVATTTPANSFAEGLQLLDTTNARFAVFGYNAAALSGNAPHFFKNDLANDVDRSLFIYNDLTVRTDRDGAARWFEEVEKRSKFDYKLFSCNCFSPILSTMNWATASQMYATLPYFRESLMLTVPMQSNFGFGTSSNSMLRPYIDMAAASVHALAKNAREK